MISMVVRPKVWKLLEKRGGIEIRKELHIGTN
jgi:hypothetical protein